METQQIEAFQTIAIAPKNRGWLIFWVVLLAAGVLALLAYPVLRSGYFYQINYNEGWNAYHQKEAVDGLLRYTDPAADPFTPVILPPLSFYTAGLAGWAVGDYLIPGRILSLLALAASGLFSGSSLRARGTRRRTGFFAGLAAIAILAAYAPEFMGMNDPHLSALALTLAGLLVYAAYGEKTVGIVISAVLFSAAICTSQNAFPALLAAALDVILLSRKRGLIFLFSIAASFLLLDGITGFHTGGLFLQQFRQMAGFSFDIFLSQLTRFDLVFLILLLITGWAAIIGMFQPRLRLFSFYFFLAAITGFAFAGNSLSGVFQFFDLFAAMGLMAGLSINRVPSIFHRVPGLSFAATWILPPLLVFCLLFNLPERLPKANTLNLLSSMQSNFERDVAEIRNTPGKVFCENLLLCFYAGKPMELDATTATELAIQGASDEKLILAVFETRQFDRIQLNRTIPKELETAGYIPDVQRMGSMTRNMRIAILKNYRFEHRGGTGVFYIPLR